MVQQGVIRGTKDIKGTKDTKGIRDTKVIKDEDTKVTKGIKDTKVTPVCLNVGAVRPRPPVAIA